MIFDEIRAAGAQVAAKADHVTIVADQLAPYAATLTPDALAALDDDPAHKRLGDDEGSVAFVLALDAVNFGSGYFPYIRKRPGLSGYHTIAASLRDHVARTGPITADSLRRLDTPRCAEIFGQPLDGGLAHELVGHFAVALRDLGELVAEHFGGSFTAVVEDAAHSAARLVGTLDRLAYFHDVHPYRGMAVPLYKRAQIAAFDVAFTLGGKGPARFDDLDQLTMFADNLVPHVLRVDGVLRFDAELLARIERVDDITSGSEPEVEIRAVALHCVELLKAASVERGGSLTSGQIDNILWNRGSGARYKAVPRHRTRCVYY